MSPEDRARQAAILAARNSPGNARAPIRAAASALFYECGEMPSANKLLKILGKGSLTTITDEIRSFWSEVREGAREELEIKGVPDRISGALRKLAPAIWEVALAEARSEASATIASAQSDAAERVAAVLQERDVAIRAAEVEREAHEAAVVQMESGLVANEGLSMTLQALRDQLSELHRQQTRLEEERTSLAAQVLQARSAAQKTQESADAERRRLMQEVDALRRNLRTVESTFESRLLERTDRINDVHVRDLGTLNDRLEVELRKNKHLQNLHDAQVLATSELAKQYQGLLESMSGGMKQIEERVADLASHVAPNAPSAPIRTRRLRSKKSSGAAK